MIRTLLNWFRKPEVKVVIIRRDPCRLRMAEWRADQDLTRQAAKALQDPTLRLMLDVLRTEGPQNNVLGNATLEERAVWEAIIEGYHLALTQLEWLGSYEKKAVSLEATFEPPEAKTETR